MVEEEKKQEVIREIHHHHHYYPYPVQTYPYYPYYPWTPRTPIADWTYRPGLITWGTKSNTGERYDSI